ncbi:MAG: hypothetical protein IPG90_09670 [Bacteroidetes bacterium]|nr:hypothetical protein [Bacteroidota bacterium]
MICIQEDKAENIWLGTTEESAAIPGIILEISQHKSD